jgi:hypothetical protein
MAPFIRFISYVFCHIETTLHSTVLHTHKRSKRMSRSDSHVCYTQQVKTHWLLDDVVYCTRGERTGGESYVSAIKLSVCLNLVLNPTVFITGTLECTEGNV